MKAATIILCLTILTGCSRADTEICHSSMGGTVALRRDSDSSHVLYHISPDYDTLSEWPLPYPVYQADYGDLTGNGEPEIAIGVEKKCKYWPDSGRRLFIFKLYQGQLIRPLWLGSRTGFRLLDFRIERDSTPARIITTEFRESDSTELSIQYRIKGFGIKFEKYIE